MNKLRFICACVYALFSLMLNAQTTHYLNYDGWYFANISYPIIIYGVKDNKNSLDVPSSVVDYGYVNSWTKTGELKEKIFSKSGNYWSRIKSAKTATIPSTIIKMGESIFLNNDVIENVVVNTNVDIPNSTFKSCTSLKTVSWKSPVNVGNYAFQECVKLTSMSFLGANVKSYGTYSFCNSGLESFDFSPNTTTIGSHAFENVSKPDMLLLPNSLTTISSYAFAGCSNLSLINFGKGKMSIGSNAFKNCSNLSFLIIGNGMKSIGLAAFSGCTNIKEIYIDAQIPPICEIGAFDEEVKKTATLYVPIGTFANYWNSPEWEKFNIVEKEFVPINSIQVEDTYEMIKDTRERLPFLIHPMSASIPNLNFSSSNPSVVNVSYDGFVQGLKAGTSIITISSRDGTNITKEIKVTVKEPEITEFKITPKSIVLSVNQQANLNLEIKPNNTNKSVSWSSLNNEIAVVKEKNGEVIVLARAIGETDIVANSVEYPEVSDTCHVIVVDDYIRGDVNKDNVIDATDFQLLLDMLLCRKVSSETADINLDGFVNGLDFVILSKKAPITNVEVSNIILDKTTAELEENDSLKLNAIITPNFATNKSVYWLTSDASIATVDNGVVKAHKSGTAIITAKVGNLKANCFVIVKANTADDYIPGDVNGDHEVLIDDVVNTINYVLGDIPDNFVFAAADMNADDTILIDDVVQVINAAMRINESKQHVVQQQRTYSETLYVSSVALHDGAKNYSLRLNNAGNYAAMQFDMTMPAGVDIEQIRTLVPNSHSVALRKIDGNSVRAVVASLGNEVFGTEEVVQLSYSSSAVGSVNISNAYASTPDGMIVKIKDAAFGNDMTGIKDINITTIVPSDIYDMSGRVVRKNAISVDGLKKGIYIMDGKKVVVE